jgi:uncharacterized Zn finger protein
MPNRFAAEGKCKRCGSSDFVVPDNATDESWITCDNCGQVVMTWKEFKTGALEVANADFAAREKTRSHESWTN